MALGTSASASTSLARFSSIWAMISCSAATAIARRPSALARATPRVGLGLVGLQPGADVVADVDVRDVDRDDFEGGLRIEPPRQHRLGNAVGVLQHFGVRLGRADRADDAFADAGDDRLFGRTADQLIQVGPHGDPRLDLQLNAVLGDGVERRPLAVLRPGQSITFG